MGLLDSFSETFKKDGVCFSAQFGEQNGKILYYKENLPLAVGDLLVREKNGRRYFVQSIEPAKSRGFNIATISVSQKMVRILGAEYAITIKEYAEDASFERDDCCGYCYGATRKIVVCDMSTYKGWENEPAEVVIAEQKKALRHEIVHAFFNESGLACSSNSVDNAWSRNEEMVDWFAIQGPKIYQAWQEAGAL